MYGITPQRLSALKKDRWWSGGILLADCFILFAVINAKQMSLSDFMLWRAGEQASVLLMWGGVRRIMEHEGQSTHLGFVAQQVGCSVLIKIPLCSLLTRWAGAFHRVPQALLAFVVVKMMRVGMFPASEGWNLCVFPPPSPGLAEEHQCNGLQAFTLLTR